MTRDKKSKSQKMHSGTKEKNLIRTLRQSLAKKDQEIKRLKSELATLNSAFERTGDFLKDSTEGLIVGRLVKAAASNKSLNTVREEAEGENTCPLCKASDLNRTTIKNFVLTVCPNNECDFRKKDLIDD